MISRIIMRMAALETNKNVFLKIFFLLSFGIFSTNIYTQNLEEIVITITFDTEPDTLLIQKAPLKYNKDFALSMQMDDASLSLFTHGFPVFEGGEVNGITYPGLSYSDGCGNSHNFKMSASIFVFSITNIDIHVDNSYGQLSWEQMETLYHHQWGILNHGVNSDSYSDPLFIDYSIRRNKSYIKRKLYNTTEGGVIPHIFVNPNGNSDWTIPSFNLDNISALNQNMPSPIGWEGGNVNSHGVNWTLPQNLYRKLAENINVPALADQLASSSVNEANYWCPIFTHSLINHYLFDDFAADFSYIASTYGINGLDNILMTTDEEIQDYLIVRDITTVNHEINGTSLLITYSGEVPDDLLYYSSSLVIKSDATINNIIIDGTNDYSFNGIGDTNALINVNWDGYYLIPPENYADSAVTIATNSQTQYNCWIAMDYVTVLEYGDIKNNLVNQLCEISGITYDEGFCSSGYPNFVNITGNNIILTGENAILTATDFMQSYLWNTGQTTQSITVSPQSDTKYWVDAVTKYGDNVSDTIVVTVSDSYITSHSPLFINHIFDVPDSLWVTLKEGASCVWSTGSIQNYIIVNPNSTTLFHLDVFLNDSIINNLDFYVFVEDVVDFTFDSVCFGDSTTFINTSIVNDSIIKILWDLNGNAQFNDAEGDTVKYIYSAAGNHMVGMQAYFKNDPMDFVYNEIQVGDFPDVNFEYNNTCLGSTTTFTDLSTVNVGNINQWLWYFGDNKTDNSQNTSNYYNDIGDYNVMLISWSSIGCKDSLQKTIHINDIADILLKTNNGIIIENNETVYFQQGESVTFSVSNFLSYDSVIWFDNSKNADILITEEGNYYVNVYHMDCLTTQIFYTSYENNPNPPDDDVIMNLFTPNGDGYNDLWIVNDPNIIPPFKVNVYNRSGNQVYSSNNYQNTWDGQYNENPLPQATYYYIIEDAAEIIFKGAITIIR